MSEPAATVSPHAGCTRHTLRQGPQALSGLPPSRSRATDRAPLRESHPPAVVTRSFFTTLPGNKTSTVQADFFKDSWTLGGNSSGRAKRNCSSRSWIRMTSERSVRPFLPKYGVSMRSSAEHAVHPRQIQSYLPPPVCHLRRQSARSASRLRWS